jgi:hypothetical protein
MQCKSLDEGVPAAHHCTTNVVLDLPIFEVYLLNFLMAVGDASAVGQL